MRCSLGQHIKRIKGYPDKPQTIGQHIKKRRIELGLKQTEVAEQFGMHFTSLQLWERGIGIPGVKPLPNIVRFLGYVPFACGKTDGERFSFMRRSCGMTQDELARVLRFSPCTIRRWEQNLIENSPNFLKSFEALWKELRRLEIAEIVKASVDRQKASTPQ